MDINKNKVIGIICAKKDSSRFPGKNMKKISCESMAERAVNTLKGAGISKVLLVSDIEELRHLDVFVKRPESVTRQDTPLQTTVSWAMLKYGDDYDYMVILMPNCPGILSSDVHIALDKIIKNDRINVIRSYNIHNGSENGLIVVKKDYYDNHWLDTYCHAIFTNGNEIHNEDDYINEREELEHSCNS